ncbi:TPA: hypothetical protein U1B40_002003 [Streptococcus suis]|uniref:hypothetical protein n=1 Tax=Streptococcus suis TaxID=1307 RepID=UPI0019614EE0|nr:hypothetical protein [Streptococcus suis]MBM7137040.1 hypothetical protein [Streptococcus suis]MBY4601154.1 hypothetical protein [Streptococcus suis]MCO8172456.1 hypothetical protein [Streptococcus suis]MCO8180839.1 hypothetical protein [Streptococcus suis]MCO8190971.1 hypothetical protein [Streptococcus suis]
MKKTVWNASLEESMGLVTDQYIQTSMEDIEKNGYGKKILGFLTVNLFMYLITFIGRYVDSQIILTLFKSTEVLVSIPFFLGLLVTLLYFISLKKIPQKRVLSYYYFNKYMFLLTFLFYCQIEILLVIFSTMILGEFLSIFIYSVVFMIALLERYRWFSKTSYNNLYGNVDFSNPLERYVELFVAHSRKFGWLVLIPVFLYRIFFSGGENLYRNDLIRAVSILSFPIIGLVGLYFVIALGASQIKGYYISKYMEDYRILSGYSIEDWYGKKSKRYKESLGK